MVLMLPFRILHYLCTAARLSSDVMRWRHLVSGGLDFKEFSHLFRVTEITWNINTDTEG